MATSVRLSCGCGRSVGGSRWDAQTNASHRAACPPRRGGDRHCRRATATRDSQARDGEWIAYSTAPHGYQNSPPNPTGSDVFLVREGGKPILVAGRGAGKTWNACPTFSPDGTKLAFGTKSPGRKSVSVVRVTRAGVSAAQRVRLSVRAGNSLAPCPLWSADGLRLAYVNQGKVVVRGLDGSTAPRQGR